MKEFDIDSFVMNLDTEEDKKDYHYSLYSIPSWDHVEDATNNMGISIAYSQR